MTSLAAALNPLVTALLPLVGAVFLSAIAAIVAFRRKPDELATDNDRLRKDIREVGDKYDKLRQDLNDLRDQYSRERTILGSGFDALWRCFERLRIHWGDKDMPLLDPVDLEAVEAAQALRNKD